MKSRKAARSRHKLSFAVDRAEIDISSDWVDAVTHLTAPPQAGEFPAPAGRSVPSKKSATVEDTAPVAVGATDEPGATVAENATAAAGATVAENATDVENATVALFGGTDRSTVVKNATVESIEDPVPLGSASDSIAESATVKELTTVENKATDVTTSTGARFATVAVLARRSATRTLRLRPLRRITDGLTPGQFAVYRLMYEKGEAETEEPASRLRLFRGGYLDLCRLTGLSKRGVQNVVAELQAKHVISIRQAPGHHKTQTTIYAVPREEAVLEGWWSRGLEYAVGKGKTLVNSATVEISATPGAG